MSEILMGRWDCASCGQRGLMGDAYSCSSCGAGRPADVTFYLPDDAEVITDEAEVAAAEAGTDWQCAYCDDWSPAGDVRCSGCDAPRDEAEVKQERREYASREAAPSTSDEAEQATEDRWQAKQDAYYASVEPKTSDAVEVASTSLAQGCKKVALVGAVAAAVFACCVVSAVRGFFNAREPLTLAQHGWEAAVHVEKLVTQHEGWSAPANAFEVTQEQRVHHNDKVYDHSETRTRLESYQVQEGTRPETYTERVQQGYDTETYTERVQQGYRTETYTERVQTGTRRVKAGVRDLGNGRFKQLYRDEPVYGTATRTRQVPRYENVTRTRQVPRYETVTRTRQVPNVVTRQREVPYEEKIYRDVPVYQTYYRYKVDRWMGGPGTDAKRSGTGTEITWPQVETGDRVRTAGKELELWAVFQDEDGKTWSFTPPNETAWRAVADGETLTRGELSDRRWRAGRE